MEQEKKYFAAKEADKCVEYLYQKSTDWFNILYHNKYLFKVQRSWLAYHGAYYGADGHVITFTGEQGEYSNVAINHYRNIAQIMLNMVTANRPTFQCRATNTDTKSLIQTTLGNNLLDYYMREKRLEKYLKMATEYAIVLAAGYVKMEWNSTSGEIHDYIEPSPDLDDQGLPLVNEDGEYIKKDSKEVKQPIPVYEGDVEFSNLTPFDVVFDTSKDSSMKMDWVICRSFKNKFDIAAKYPELADQIVDLSTKSEQYKYQTLGRSYDETSDIPVYEFFHRKSESMPDGRYLLYLDKDIILVDSPLVYRNIPLYRISPSDILGTPYGYTSMFDLIPIQDAVNSLYSTVLTNQSSFGVQNIWVPEGVDLNVNSIEGGLNVLSGNGQFGKPEALNLTHTPAEIFNFIKMLEGSMETVSGINSVARGNPESSLKTGSALALVQAQALQFISGLQQSYIQLTEDVGSGLMNLLQDFASVPRVAAIAGISNQTEMKMFSGDDLNTINRVIVDVGNPLANTTAGRVSMAEQLMQMKPDEFSVQDYITLINTGKLETMTEKLNSKSILMRSENEALTKGDYQVKAVLTDNHVKHIDSHSTLLDDVQLRQDAELTSRVLIHIQEHIELLRTSDPQILAVLGQQALPPVQGTPPNPETMAQEGTSPENPMLPLNPPEAGGTPMPQATQPNLPQPATVDAAMLPNPELQAQNMGNLK